MESTRRHTLMMPFMVVIVCGLMTGVLGNVVSTPNEFTWNKSDVGYPSNGYQLSGTLTALFDNAYLVTQCAYRCLQTSAERCASYNFVPALRRCELNSATHVTAPANLVEVSGSQYYLRDALTIDTAALGPCSLSPCHKGDCLTVTSSSGSLTSQCACAEGWSGSFCDVLVSQPVWSDWSAWTQCSTSCGEGMTVRNRQCTNAVTGEVISSQMCYGRDTEQTRCYLKDCPGWSNYGAWSQCSSDTQCGPGQQTRTRSCNNGGIPGIDLMCKGPSNQTTPCRSPSCDTAVRLVDGPTYGEGRVNVYDDVAAAWIPVCSTGWTQTNAGVVCKQLGFPSGSYVSAQGTPTYGNQPDSSSAMSTVSCQGDEKSLANCPHGTWHSASCASGPHAGVQCIVDGKWSNWTEWTQCSVSCADGVQTRQRQCNSPAPQRGGLACQGNASETKTCSNAPCPVDGVWSDWSEWNTCNATCGSGNKQRHRTCTPPLNGGADCQGNSVDSQFCNDNPCPVNGQWSAWSRWLDCSVSCGDGTQNRYRICDGATNGGSCNGDDKQYEDQKCNNGPCTIPGLWTPWSDWSVCSATCGTDGLRTRTRSCNMTSFGSLTSDCLPTDGIRTTDSRACNVFSCTPIAQSCQELVTRGLEDARSFVFIDADGTGPLEPFGVECQVADGVVTTLIHTATEQETTVQGYTLPGSYVATIQYVDNNMGAISSAQVIALVDKSVSCRQYTAWNCYSAAINSPSSNTGGPYKITWLNNRYNKALPYWGGASAMTTASATVTCACGQTSTCAKPNTMCNCDSQDSVWRFDDGYVTKKLDLPIMSIAAGDTGVSAVNNKMGKFTVGPLICN